MSHWVVFEFRLFVIRTSDHIYGWLNCIRYGWGSVTNEIAIFHINVKWTCNKLDWYWYSDESLCPVDHGEWWATKMHANKMIYLQCALWYTHMADVVSASTRLVSFQFEFNPYTIDFNAHSHYSGEYIRIRFKWGYAQSMLSENTFRFI